MAGLINEIKNKAKGIKTMPVLHKDDLGAWFEEQPPGTRPATMADFTDHNGNLLNNMPYLIHSELHPERFEAHRTRPGFTRANDFMLFLERGRIYVFENSLNK